MKLLRYGPIGKEKPGLLDGTGTIRSLAEIISDITPETLTRLDDLRAIQHHELPAVAPQRLGPCVTGVGKFICVGLNYADHAAETGAPIPQEPELFSKAVTAISGPNDPIIQPRNSTKLDWEVELALVIGKTAHYVSIDDAAEAIAGYFICHDVSERAFQLERGSQWDKGKGCDSFGPIGPWLVTADEVQHPDRLDLWLEVNGHRYQSGNTTTMIFKPDFIVSYVSQFMRLMPGDIITTGTPPGVGLGQKPPIFLRPGDRVRLGIEGLGEQEQLVVSAN